MTNTTGQERAMTPLIEWVVELARRDIKRTQTDFIGRMNQAMGEFEAICDDRPDGDFDEAARDDAGEALAGLAGLAIAQLAMVGWPDDPLAALSYRDGHTQGVWARAFAAHRTAAVAELVECLRPFVDLGPQKGAWGVISKNLGDFAPMTVTVTKAQMLAACNAVHRHQAGLGKGDDCG